MNTFGRSPLQLLLFLLSAIFVVAGFAVTITHYSALPDQIPIHFNIKGNPDGWASKPFAFLLPGVAVFQFILLSLATRFPTLSKKPFSSEETNRIRYQVNKRFLPFLLTLVSALFLYLQWAIIQVALGSVTGLNSFVMLGFVVVLLGSVLVHCIKFYRLKRSQSE